VRQDGLDHVRVTFGPYDTLFSVAGLLFILGGLESIPLLRTAPGGEQAQSAPAVATDLPVPVGTPCQVDGDHAQISRFCAQAVSAAGYTNFNAGQINVAQGEKATGAVTFQLPTGVKVSKVQWTPAAGFGDTVQWNAP
jgi:hypothetical protein